MADSNSTSNQDDKTREILQNFLEDEILSAQESVRRSRLFGVIIIGVVCLYMGYITNGLRAFLEPKQAAEFATMFVSSQVASKTDLVATRIQEKIPELITGLPDHLLKEIPGYREDVEESVVSTARAHMTEVAAQLDANLKLFLEENQENVKALLASDNELTEPDEAFKEALFAQIMDFLETVPPDGNSLADRLATSLKMLSDAEANVEHLTKNQNLGPSERKTRYALAVLADSISDDLHRFELNKKFEQK